MYSRTSYCLSVLALALCSAVAFSQNSFARDSDYDFDFDSRDRESLETKHLLNVGGGISSPALTSSTYGNPSGLVYNQSTKLVGSVATGFQAPDLLGNGIRLLTGNSYVGGALGIETYNNTTDEDGSLTYLNFGLATYIEKINLSVGLAGNYRLARRGRIPGPQYEKTWTGNLGALFNPFGGFRLGFTLFGLSQGIEAGGVGTAISLNKYSILSIDAATTKQGNGLVVKPALGINASPFQLSYGYGIQVDENQANTAIAVGNTIGLGYEFTQSLRLEAYYNQASLYYVGANMKF